MNCEFSPKEDGSYSVKATVEDGKETKNVFDGIRVRKTASRCLVDHRRHEWNGLTWHNDKCGESHYPKWLDAEIKEKFLKELKAEKLQLVE